MYERMGFVRSQSGRHFGAARPRGCVTESTPLLLHVAAPPRRGVR